MKKGLVVEGGGMRGAHSCGAIMGLFEGGVTSFDVVSATSAGACTAAYFVSGQMHLFPSIWADYLHERRFIDLRKLLTRRSVMNLDYLIHTLFGNLIPLDLEAIRKSPTRFYIVATDCETGEAVYFNNHEHPILESLKASSAMPFAWRNPVTIDRHRYVDGGIGDSIPIQKAIDEGCEEVTLILTRPEGYRKKRPLLNLAPRLFRKKFPKLAKAMAHRHERYNRTMERIEKGDYPCRLTVIRPRTKLPVGRFTTDRERIVAAIEQGRRDAACPT